MSLILYGCYGYTGRLLAEEALKRGLRPTLAGRNREAVETMGRALGLSTKVADLDDPASLDAALGGHAVVLHAAGPFSRTSKPMADACLRNRLHYLDVTGEILVFEALAARDKEAKERGVSLLPGVGFDVVPSDCLAAHVAQKVPGATELTIALSMGTSTSQGTALTMVESLGKPGAVRKDGRITPVPPGHAERDFDFGQGVRRAVAIPWGDVSTAFHSTGIPNIVTFLSAPTAVRLGMRASGLLGPILGSAPVKRFLSSRIKAGAAGPTDEERARRESRLYAEATAPDGRRAAARLVAHEAYTLTAETGIRIAEVALAGNLPAGFTTPSRALGADFILGIPGTKREDLA